MGSEGWTVFHGVERPSGRIFDTVLASNLAEEDARLITAAPDLLDALKICQVRIFVLDGSENNEYQSAEAAISKATSGESRHG